MIFHVCYDRAVVAEYQAHTVIGVTQRKAKRRGVRYIASNRNRVGRFRYTHCDEANDMMRTIIVLVGVGTSTNHQHKNSDEADSPGGEARGFGLSDLQAVHVVHPFVAAQYCPQKLFLVACIQRQQANSANRIDARR